MNEEKDLQAAIKKILSDLENLSTRIEKVKIISDTSTVTLQEIKMDLLEVKAEIVKIKALSNKHDRVIYGENGLVGILSIVNTNANQIAKLVKIEEGRAASKESRDDDFKKIQKYAAVAGFVLLIVDIFTLIATISQLSP